MISSHGRRFHSSRKGSPTFRPSPIVGSRSRSKSGSMKAYSITGIVVVAIFIFSLLLRSPDHGMANIKSHHNLQPPPSAFRTAHQGNSIRSPFESRPPDSIPFFATDQLAIKKRHECIKRIREYQMETLRPYIPSGGEWNNDLRAALHSHRPTQQQQQARRRRVLLVDPAYHGNVGDHMITVGEMEFLGRLQYNTTTNANANLSEGDVDQCHFIQAGGFVPDCRTVIINSSSRYSRPVGVEAALWHGGGNWGDLWPGVQQARLDSFAPLLAQNYTVVSMPQSLHYQDHILEQHDAERLLALFYTNQRKSLIQKDPASYHHQQQPRMILSWREYESYDQARSLYPWAQHVLLPDIAFQLGPYAALPPELGSDQPPRVDLLLLLRNDRESLYISQRNRQSIQQILDHLLSNQDRASGRARRRRVTFSIVDWPDRLERFPSTTGSGHGKDIFFTKTAIQLLSLGRVVICDRLHAAILAYLTGLPVVMVDPLTGKISKTWRVAFHVGQCPSEEEGQWARAANLSHAVARALNLLDATTGL